MANCSYVAFHLPKGFKLSIYDGDKLPGPEVYRRVIGKLLYLNMIKPDISYAIQQLSQFLSDPRMSHFLAAQHALKYLKVLYIMAYSTLLTILFS